MARVVRVGCMNAPGSGRKSVDAARLSGVAVLADESAGFALEQGRLVAVRRVPAIWDHQQAGFRQSPGDGADLLEAAVLVVLPLSREHRAADGPDLVLDVPGAECG